MNLYDVIIIGAGPSGLFSAIHCSKANNKVLVLEKNESAGKKLLISGAGQCNITHDGDIKEFFNRYGDHGKYIRYLLSKFTNNDVIEFFNKQGIQFVINEEGKVFPKTKSASDILNILLDLCDKSGVNIYYKNKVTAIHYKDCTFQIKTDHNTYYSKYLIIATGGKSYPKTGSEGDGFNFAQSLGHNIQNPTPALTPLYIRKFPFKDLAGVSFEDMGISVWRGDKKIYSFIGDLLLTHKGISGPVILNNSRYIKENDVIKLSFLSFASEESFRNEFIKQIDSNSKKRVTTLVKSYPIPKRLGDKLCELLHINEDLQCANMSKSLRKKLIEALIAFPLEVEKLGGFHVAMVTKGGISLKEINSKTMESKIIKNLYFVGEVLDIDGDTGGYNIQAAFSTAVGAARDIIKKC